MATGRMRGWDCIYGTPYVNKEGGRQVMLDAEVVEASEAVEVVEASAPTTAVNLTVSFEVN